MLKPLTVWITTNCGNFFKRWEYQTILPVSYKPVCRSRTTVRTLHETTDWFKIEKGVWQGCILSLCLFNLYIEYIMQNARLDELQAGIKIAIRNIKNLRYVDDTTLMAESKGELFSSCMRMWELDYKEGWVPKNWCFKIVVLKKTLEIILDSKEIKAVNPKGNQPWILIGSTDAEAPIFATWCKQGTHWKSLWCWERLKRNWYVHNKFDG